MSNQNFSRINSAAGQVNNLNVGSGTFGTLTVNSLTADDTITTTNKGSIITRYAYAPTSFSSLAQDGVVSLMNKPGLAQATSTADDLFVLPQSSRLLRAIVTNNGTTITSSGSAVISVLCSETINLNSGIPTLITASTPIADVNTSIMVGGGVSTVIGETNANFNSPGAVPGTIGFNSTNNALNIYLNANTSTAGLTGGDLRVEIQYFNALS